MWFMSMQVVQKLYTQLRVFKKNPLLLIYPDLIIKICKICKNQNKKYIFFFIFGFIAQTFYA